ncbi:MAG: hypothetical protein ACE5HZ_09745, partial [Fidelibacterota bacterium]
MKTLSLFALLTLSPLFGDSLAVEVIGLPLELHGGDPYLMAPQWSPAGTTLAVTGRNYRGIYLLSFPGGETAVISEDPGAGSAMRWSPGGDRILAVVSKYENRRRYNAVVVFDPVSGQKNLITDYSTTPTGAPRWSKDGKKIFLVGDKSIESFPAERGGTRAELSEVTPQEIVLSDGDRIVIHSLPTKRREIVEAVKGHKLNLTVSPDGKKMAFEIMGGHLWVTSINGQNAVDLGTGYRPAWAPTSDRLTYMISTDDGHRYLSSDIYVSNADGTGRTHITSTEDRLEM